MFPPKKPTPGIGPGGPPPDLAGGGAPAGPPTGPPPGGLPFMSSPTRPKPGQGMDPYQAMSQGLGPDILSSLTPPQGPQPLAPTGSNGLPFGGSMPAPGGPDDGDDMGGSDLLQALAGAISGGAGGDPYDAGRFPPNLNVGTQDPNMGLEQMLQALALAQMGVGGQPGAGGSGVPFDQSPSMGGMAGLY